MLGSVGLLVLFWRLVVGGWWVGACDSEHEARQVSELSAPRVVEDKTGEGSGCGDLGTAYKPRFRPLDLIVFVDTSGSMVEEIPRIAEGTSDLAEFFAASGIDYRVILVSDLTVCAPPPLSTSLSCPDRNGPRFRHVLQTVASNDGPRVLIASASQWTDFLREGSVREVIGVTDDDSDMEAGAFVHDLQAIIGDFTYHAIATPSLLVCSEGARDGTQHRGAVALTAGTFHNICEADWTLMFEAIATSSAGRVATDCEFLLPDVGRRRTIDLDATTVTAAIDGVPTAIPSVGLATGCADVGWGVDSLSNPTVLTLCGGTCDAYESLQISLSCRVEDKE